eukprot:s1182_g2.t1
MTLDLFVADNACDTLGPVGCLEHGPEKAKVTSPEVFDGELNSIKFAPEKSYTCVKVKLGREPACATSEQKNDVLIWKLDEVIDDSSLMQLDATLEFEGMKEEIQNLKNTVQARLGRIPCLYALSLPRGFVIVLKLPQSVSLPHGSQAYLLLYKALSGLRDASLHWLNLLSDIVSVRLD